MSISYTQYVVAIHRAARHTAPLLKRLGMDLEDCEQEARLAFLQLPAATLARMNMALAYTVCRRALLKLARKRNAVAEPDGALWIETVEDCNHGVTSELFDLFEAAPHPVNLYLGFRVLDGMTWDECKEALEVSNDRLVTIRATAAEWILANLEGRKAK